MLCFLLYRIYNVFFFFAQIWVISASNKGGRILIKKYLITDKFFYSCDCNSLGLLHPDLLLFLHMLMLCHPSVPLTTLLHQQYGNNVTLGIKHMKKLCYFFLLGYNFVSKEHFLIQNQRMKRTKFNSNLHIKHQHIGCS